MSRSWPGSDAGPGSGPALEALSGDRLARAALSRVGEPGDPRLTDLVHQLGAEQVWHSLREQGRQGQLGDDLAERIRGTDPGAELSRANAAGIRFVVPEDTEWPASLDDLARAPHLHERGGVPVGLWVRGPLRLDEASERAVAIVGSRSATTYGGEVAGGIATTAADAGYTVISGAAFGIDQAAHRGALTARGPTIAVLACGVDRAYPKAHERLIAYIGETGLLVSEAAPRCAPTRIRFLARNRLIAALAQGTVVVEAADRSGALNTATWSQGLNRTVMGVPGPVTSETSVGVHQLIRGRDALLVTNGAEVLEAIGPVGSFLLTELRADARPRDALSALDRQTLDAVPLRQGVSEASIARTAGLSRAKVGESLRRLHGEGHVEHALGRWRLTDPVREC